MSKAKKPAKKAAATKPAARPKAPTKVRVYLVVRQAFEGSDYEGTHYPKARSDGDDPNEVPVRAFASETAADDFAQELDADLRATFPPPLFACDDDDDNAGPRVEAAVAALGLPEFKGGKYNCDSGPRFVKWWAKHAANLNAEQRAALWQPFAGMTFHRVRTVEVEG